MTAERVWLGSLGVGGTGRWAFWPVPSALDYDVKPQGMGMLLCPLRTDLLFYVLKSEGLLNPSPICSQSQMIQGPILWVAAAKVKVLDMYKSFF